MLQNQKRTNEWIELGVVSPSQGVDIVIRKEMHTQFTVVRAQVSESYYQVEMMMRAKKRGRLGFWGRPWQASWMR